MTKSKEEGKLVRRIEIQVVFFFLLSFTIYLFLVFWGNLPGIIESVKHLSLIFIFLATLTTLTNYFLRFLRFRFLLSRLKIKLSFLHSLLISLSGLAMSVTPGKGGELLKAYFISDFSPSISASFAYSAPVVIFERLSDALGTFILLSWGLWHYQSIRWLIFSTLAGVALFIFLITNTWFIDKVYFFFKKVSFLNFLTNHLQNFHQGSKQLLQPTTLTISSLISLFAWLAEVGTFAIIYFAFTNHLDLNTLAILAFVFTFTSILGFLSFLPGGIIVTEGGKIGFLILIFHLKRSLAVTIVLLVRLLTLWLGVAIGSIALLYLIHLQKKNAYS